MFRRPIGAVKDMKELEYIAALHQTKDDTNFMNGSIDAADVKAFLMSRYGIDLHKEDVRRIIFNGLAGGEGEERSIDIVETVAILIIPLLVKITNRMKNSKDGVEDNNFSSHDESADDNRQLGPPPNIIADVLKCILMDTSHTSAGAAEGNDTDSILENPPKLTPQLLKAIFIESDEFDMLEEDDLIAKMIADATGGKEDAVLDVETFARGLTQDVQLYDTDGETRHTTILNDVFPYGFTRTTTDSEKTKKADEEEVSMELIPSFELRRVFTFSEIDFTTDNLVSRSHVVLIWLVLVFSWFFYMFNAGFQYSVCDSTKFGCKVANAILVWLQIMVKLVFAGTLVGCGLSMGNGEFNRNQAGPIIGIASVGLFIMFPAWYTKINTFVFSTDLEEIGPLGDVKFILVSFGVLLVVLQIRNLMATKTFIPDILLGGSGKASYLSKQATIYKVNEMVRNAYELHKNVNVYKAGEEDGEENDNKNNVLLAKILKKKEDEAVDETEAEVLLARALAKQTAQEEVKRINQRMKKDKSSKERALENFSNIMDETEAVGGVFWAWKEYLSNNLQQTEGVWLSSRLIAATFIQFVAITLIFAANIYTFVVLIGKLFPDLTIDRSATCFSNFDYEQCYFPFGGEYGYTGTGICADVTLQDEKCLDLFKELPIDSPFLDRTCETIDQAYQVLESFTPGNMTCSETFGELSDLFTNATTIELFGGYEASLTEYAFCYNYVKDYKVRTEGMNETLYQLCGDFRGNVDDLITPIALDNNATMADAVNYCLVFYPHAYVQSLCQRNLYQPTTGISTYEIKSEEDGICRSVLTICAPTSLDFTRGTCVIGERNFQPFQFEGPGCKNYPEINATLNFYDEQVAPHLNQIADIFPKKWQVEVTAAFAIITATLISLASSVVYIPSAIHTIMKFRSGVIPSLRDPGFLKYRRGLHNMPYMIGVMFWGLVTTTIFLTFAVAVVVFLLVWHVSRDYLLTFTAQIIGILVTILIKIVVCTVFTKVTYAGFYRNYPAAANIFSFSLECWYLALTIGFVFSRLIKFLVVTGLYVGRIDRPVFAEDLLLDIDSLPRVFRQNLLSTDSHRHPYIELLGLMYLMKLRHKDNFCTGSGSAWRLLFVIVLMPWLKKKRIEDKRDDEDGDKRFQIGLVVDELFGGVAATS